MGSQYLGFDFSTQQIKAVVINEKLHVKHEESVKFDDLRTYCTTGGFHIQTDGLTVTAPTIMWVEALDVLMDKLKKAGADFSKIKSLSGSGQQHGSVYWRKGAAEVLQLLNPNLPLHMQLNHCFSVTASPIWMDSSTTKQCRELEEAIGGAQPMADLTGSRAYERFTGNQILKIIQTQPNAYTDTERISLVSSFAATLFRGAYCNIDESDASGMNLMSLTTRDWDDTLIKKCAADLAEKLGPIDPTLTVQGPISKYFVDRYGFDAGCQVVTFTGDNPASLAGMRLGSSDIAVSLGSSDVIFLWLNHPQPKTEGHVFVNPIMSSDYMALLCFKNGSLTREHIRDKYCEGSWELFSQALCKEPVGNNGNIGLYYTCCEIIPNNARGCFYFNMANDNVDDFSPSTHVRAIIEGQFISRRVHAENMGFRIEPNTRILATGGASNNKAILQVLSDVFGAPVYTQEVANSASLGAAFLAMHAVNLGTDYIAFQERLKDGPKFELVAMPQSNTDEIYAAMCGRYRALEEKVMTLIKERGTDS